MGIRAGKPKGRTKPLHRFGIRFRATRALTMALHERDEHTRHHCDRVALLAEAMGRALRLGESDMGVLRFAGRFHDLGKIGIPDAILFKESRFTEGEWEIMKTHSEKGERIIRATGLAGAEPVAQAIRHHHENHDGSGYPDGLSGDAIPLLSQIISIADAYDAMRSARPNRQAMGRNKVMTILESESGWKFAPAIFEQFRAIIGRLSPSCT